VKAENRTLEDWQAEYLYAHHPGLGRDHRSYCPTCMKTGSYRWQEVDRACDCRVQLNLHKLYLWAGIGATYQRVGWQDWHGDPSVPILAANYVSKGFAQRGTGLIFMGIYGTGKTMAANLILKDLLKAGLSVYATTLSAMIDKYTGGWRDEEERAVFTAQVVDSDVLLIDDAGRSQRSSAAAKKFHESTLDDILRPRAHGGKATLITSNLDTLGIAEVYGEAIASLIKGHFIAHTFTGVDYREAAGGRNADELLRGEIRPIL
jgi:DNA replication protein DnaC